ncbi:hypothetical protein G7Z17_g3685 [Cylindrodendrum hubeiense]|uniref:Zn(2)-C6 fungal-type domain-containing protein n=1 Tax=Cylindrodendrum hubeiense TaxID=595255 RepID=A0A9P5HC26_9HYPO|nr:hypothetical protein G7Z17_g3685 [Cylindrodendrum hubeiense]
MAESAPSLNALSVRCNRVMPTCDRCRLQGFDCIYPERVKRQSRKGLSGRLVPTDSPLSTILQRLQRVEEHVISLNPLPPGSDASPEAPRVNGRRTRSSNAAPEAAFFNGSTVSSPASHASPSILTAGTNTPRTSGSSYPLADVDITAVLVGAVGQVQRLRLQYIAKATLTAGITIPAQLAKDWIDNYFTQMRADAFLSLIDAKLIRQIPDIIDSPFIHLDAAILVVYYGVLYHGCSLPTSLTNNPHHIQYARQVYLCCLRSLPNWQREASGTTTDFIAAMLTARVSAECFDYDLSWQLFKQACEYAHGLNMHNLDGGDGFNCSSGSKVDSDRRGFWELIQVELFFRLLYNKPPTLTESMNSWRVNLPYLSPDAQPDLETVPTLAFLVSSRITFVLTDFFQLIEEHTPGLDILPKIESLGEEVETLFQEWQMDEWIKRADDNDIHWWMLVDIALTGYTSIIFMLRKYNILESSSPSPVSSDHDVPRSPLAIRASRRILDIIYRLLVKVPHSETMSLMVGFFQAFIPYAYLASNIVHSPNPGALVSDLVLLESITEKIAVIAQDERDFTPLVRTLQNVNSECGGIRSLRLHGPRKCSVTERAGAG